MERLKLKKVTSLEKVFPKKEPTGNGWKDTVTVLQGETMSFQIAYIWNGPGKQIGRAHV